MAAPAVLAPGPPRTPEIVVRGQRIPVILPRRGDPRLRLSAVIVTLHVLGQAFLEFKVSIAQILVSIGVGALIEGAVLYRRQHQLVWPASGILTGSGVAFILRASGTDNGDWWSLNGIGFFVVAVALSLASKHLLRPGGRHVFNPSNVGLVWALLVIGPSQVFPQYLWWGPNELAVAAAYGVILVGAVWILRPVRMMPMVVSFLAPFAVLVAILAAMGQSFVAIWHDGPVEGLSYWLTIAWSPELLVFVFFMMSDPQTAPRQPRARMLYGLVTAVVAAGLISFQPTEFGIKLAILSSLTVACALVPLIEAAARRSMRLTPLGAGWARAAPRPVVAAIVIIAVAAPVNTAVLAANDQIMLIERGLTGEANAQ
ncbi:MAG: RnfABCDGE type electron transport complex subunit D [Actinobacteria bacterium]|nr:RnfABCDGE type electron transport complex subunit D [Actinomycetota bacterium]